MGRGGARARECVCGGGGCAWTRPQRRTIQLPGCSSLMRGSAYEPAAHIHGPHAWFCWRESTTRSGLPLRSAVRMRRQPSH